MCTVHRRNWMISVMLAVTGAALALPSVVAADTTLLVGPTRAGKVEPANVRAGFSHDTSQLRMVTHPGASVIFVHFRDLALAPGVELVVSDPSQTVSHTYPGAGLSTDSTPGSWALGLPGDAA